MDTPYNHNIAATHLLAGQRCGLGGLPLGGAGAGGAQYGVEQRLAFGTYISLHVCVGTGSWPGAQQQDAAAWQLVQRAYSTKLSTLRNCRRGTSIRRCELSTERNGWQRRGCRGDIGKEVPSSKEIPRCHRVARLLPHTWLVAGNHSCRPTTLSSSTYNRSATARYICTLVHKARRNHTSSLEALRLLPDSGPSSSTSASPSPTW